MQEITICQNGVTLPIDLVSRKKALWVLGLQGGGSVDDLLDKYNVKPVVKIPIGASRSKKFYLKKDIAYVAILRISRLLQSIEKRMGMRDGDNQTVLR